MSAPLSQILIFFFVMTVVLGGAHFYLWRRLVKEPGLKKPVHISLTVVLVALMISLPTTMVALRIYPRESISQFAFGAFIWMGLLSTYFALLVLSDFFQLLSRKAASLLKGKPKIEDPTRRRAAQRLVASSVALSGAGIGSFALNNALNEFKVVEIDVHLEKLPDAFDGLRIVQLSDIHVGPTIGRDFVSQMVERTNQLNPDIVAITGDLVDGSVKNLAPHTRPLEGLKPTLGSYFVPGNHDYYSGADEWMAEVKRLGISVLRNESVKIRRGDASFVLAGVTDYRAAQYGDPPDIQTALTGRKPEDEVVLLAHQPREIFRAKAQDVGLQISGHTHGGQFWPWNWVIHLIEPVVAGLEQFGRTQIYVNSGTGYWGPPMRLGTDSEITVITLRSTPATLVTQA